MKQWYALYVYILIGRNHARCSYVCVLFFIIEDYIYARIVSLYCYVNIEAFLVDLITTGIDYVYSVPDEQVMMC